MGFTLAPIVEGHGDVIALPILLRRMNPALIVKRPVRFPKTKLLIPEHLQRAAIIAASNIQPPGAVLLVMDSDEECAATRAAEMVRLLGESLPGHLCKVALAVREFEAWIVGGDDYYAVPDADVAGNLKGRIRQRYGVYSETADQPRLIARADLSRLEQSSRSFRHLKSVVKQFVSKPD